MHNKNFKKILSLALAVGLMTGTIKLSSYQVSAKQSFDLSDMTTEQIRICEQKQIEELAIISRGRCHVSEGFTKDLDPQIGVRILAELNYVFKMYPNIFGILFNKLERGDAQFYIDSFTPEKESTLARTNIYMMRFNKNSLSSLERFLSEEIKEVETRCHSPVDKDQFVEGIVAHEIGHLISKILYTEIPEYQTVGLLANLAFSENATATLKSVSSYLKKKVLEIAKTTYNYPNSFISAYGMQGEDEWFAEVSAHYFCSENPNPLGCAMGDFLRITEKKLQDAKSHTEAKDSRAVTVEYATAEKEALNSVGDNPKSETEGLKKLDESTKELLRLYSEAKTAHDNMKIYETIINNLSKASKIPSWRNFHEIWMAYLEEMIKYDNLSRECFIHLEDSLRAKGIIKKVTKDDSAPKEDFDYQKFIDYVESNREILETVKNGLLIIPDKEFHDPKLKDEFISQIQNMYSTSELASLALRFKNDIVKYNALSENALQLFIKIKHFVFEEQNIKEALSKANEFIVKEREIQELNEQMRKDYLCILMTGYRYSLPDTLTKSEAFVQ